MKYTAQAVLLNSEGYVLGVSRKTDFKDFGLPGGKMSPEDAGDMKATAIRETLEETGLKIYDLRLVFAIHKDGFMSYTYLADYTGKINHNEPHLVKWLPFEILTYGSFGKYNQLVSESLVSMGIKFLRTEPPKEKFLYAIDRNGIIHLTSQIHWDKNKTKGVVMTREGLEDLNSIQENSNIIIHDIINPTNGRGEQFIISRKDSVQIDTTEETEELLKQAGFIKNNDFIEYINNENNIVHKI